jgi:hypothetical protein
MENNLPINPTNQTNQGQMPQQTAPVQPISTMVQQPQPQMPQAAVPPQNSHIVRTILIMIILAIVVLLTVLIYVSLVNNQQSGSSSIQIQNTISPAPKSAQITDEQELNSIVVGDVDADLQEIDTDLNSL